MIQRILRISGLVSLAVFLLWGAPAIPATGEVNAPLQILVVTMPAWSGFNATLTLFERKDTESPWIATFGPISAVVGRNGLAWGKGIHPEPPAGGPQKREGDGKAPAGIFRLGLAFGYPPGESVPWIRLPYRQMTERIKCVDDGTSPFYNRLVDVGSVRANWQSHEDMRRRDDQYRLGIVIEHNSDPVFPGGGSCIFLHIWDAPLKGTAGCTAVSAPAMEEILRRLRPEANPLLVQLPRGEYERLSTVRGFPGSSRTGTTPR